MIKILVILVILLVAAFVWLNYNRPIFVSEAKVFIGFKVIDVEIAETSSEHFRGLSGRDSLCEDCGTLFVFDQAKIQKFSMRGMRFPLDMIFIRDGKIAEIVENIPYPQSGELPVNINSRDPADMVLEVNAGFAKKNSVPVGQTVRLER